MSLRTYVPKLLLLASAVCLYFARYRQTIAENLTAEEYTQVSDAIDVLCDVVDVLSAIVSERTED